MDVFQISRTAADTMTSATNVIDILSHLTALCYSNTNVPLNKTAKEKEMRHDATHFPDKLILNKSIQSCIDPFTVIKCVYETFDLTLGWIQHLAYFYGIVFTQNQSLQ